MPVLMRLAVALAWTGWLGLAGTGWPSVWLAGWLGLALRIVRYVRIVCVEQLGG